MFEKEPAIDVSSPERIASSQWEWTKHRVFDLDGKLSAALLAGWAGMLVAFGAMAVAVFWPPPHKSHAEGSTREWCEWRISVGTSLQSLNKQVKQLREIKLEDEPTPAEKSVLVSVPRKTQKFAAGDRVWLILSLPRKPEDSVTLYPRYVREVSSDGKVVRCTHSEKSEGPGDWFDAASLRHADLLENK